MKYNVASLGAPSQATLADFITDVQTFMAEFNCKLLGYHRVNGPGCYNNGFIVEGDKDKAEQVMRSLTMAMGGRYCEVPDSDPGVVEGQFEITE